jgi:hypothetical protein
MKAAATLPLVLLSLASGVALAQSVSPRGTPVVGHWVISETSSPVDYSPIVVATTYAPGRAENSAMQLNVSCRNGVTELVVTGPAISSRGDDYAFSYHVNSNAPVQIPGGKPISGVGAQFTGDIVGLLRALPNEGDFAIRLVPRAGEAVEGHFSLDGLNVVRDKLAGACKWPQVIAKPPK